MERTGDPQGPAVAPLGVFTSGPGAPLRFAVRFVLIGLALYAALYFPHDAGSLPGRMLAGYVKGVALLAGGLLRIFDSSVSVTENLINGRFNLAIVLDCAAIDAQALFAATVLAFAAPWRKKVLGLGAGIAIITIVNLARIVALYFVGLNWPSQFRLFHEDVFQLGIIAAACGSFAVWALWVCERRTEAHAAA